jgi:hypothetical protein
MGQGGSTKLAAANKEAEKLLSATEMTMLEKAWDRIGHGHKLDAKSFQKAVFSSFIMMVGFSIFMSFLSALLLFFVVVVSNKKYCSF